MPRPIDQVLGEGRAKKSDLGWMEVFNGQWIPLRKGRMIAGQRDGDLLSIPQIPQRGVKKVHDWLGQQGVEFFWRVITAESLAQQHFEAGMQVRNFMKSQDEFSGWTQHDLDNAWMTVIRHAVGPAGGG